MTKPTDHTNSVGLFSEFNYLYEFGARDDNEIINSPVELGLLGFETEQEKL